MDPNALTKAQAKRLYLPKNALPVRPALTTPQFWAHRGGASFAPEQSEDAYKISAALGADVLDGDLQRLGDLAFIMMHNSTVDATTDGTGSLSNYTTPSLIQLNAAAKFAWPKSTPPQLVADMITKYGPTQYLSLEPKDHSAASDFLDLCDRLGAGQSVIINTNNKAVMTLAKSRGYKVYFYWPTGSGGTRNNGVGDLDGDGVALSIAAAVAAGVDFFGCDYTTQAASIPDLVATTIPVIPYSILTRTSWAAALAAGVSGALSDQWYYIKTAVALTKIASWARGVYGHGFLPAPILAGNASIFAVTGGGLEIGSGGGNVVVGELCPVANAASTYVIDCDLSYKADPSASGTPAMVIAFALPDDTARDFSSSNTNNPVTGYMAYMRWNGQLSMFKYGPAGAKTTLGSVTTAAMTVNGVVHLRIRVTSTTVAVVRTDVSLGTTSAALTSGVAVTSIPVTALAAAIPAGAVISLGVGQNATVASTAAIGATAITVNSFTPTATIASGTAINPALQFTDSSYRGGYIQVGWTAGTTTVIKRFANLTVS